MVALPRRFEQRAEDDLPPGTSVFVNGSAPPFGVKTTYMAPEPERETRSFIFVNGSSLGDSWDLFQLRGE